QEEIINQLDKENEKLRDMYTLLGTVVICLSVAIQVFAILGLMGPGAGLATTAFGLFHLCLHAHAMLVLRRREEGNFSEIGGKRIETPPFLPTQLLVVLYPALSSLMASRVDWAFAAAPLVATGVVWISLKAIEEGKRGISNLQTLKYDAKGA
ncbi:hypothetical protein FRC17_003639, partial [Serendipita sp. 399]